jgi:hypothetical protein
LIIGGSLASVEITETGKAGAADGDEDTSRMTGGTFTDPFTNDTQEAPSSIGRDL